MKTTKKELIIIVTIAIIALSGFLIFRSVFKTPSKNPAIVQHWYANSTGFNVTEDLVLIDFDKKKVTILNEQSGVPSEYGSYPQINLENNTVTVLGEYVEPKSKKRQELVVEYDFINRTVEIIEETSPKGICSNMGKQVKFPLICLPNQMKVIFDIAKDDGIDYEQ